MQNINVYLRADSVSAKIVDSYNQIITDVPAIVRGVHSNLVLKLLNDDGSAMSGLADFFNWEFILATDWLTTTPPQIRVNSGITVIDNEIHIPLLETNTDELISALGNSETITIGAELTGFDSGETTPAFLIQFNMQIRNRRGDAGTGSPEPVDDGNYSATQIDALLSAGFEVEYSTDGEIWTDDEDANYFRFRHAQIGGEWSPSVKLVVGPRGYRSTINVGTVTTGEPSSEVVFTNIGDENDAIFDISIPEGKQGEIGETGDKGDKGDHGENNFVYLAYAEENNGQGFSLTPADSLKYRAEIVSSVLIENLDLSHFANAEWIKYIGDDQTVYGDILVADTENSVTQVNRIVFENATIREGIDGEVIVNFKEADFVTNAELNAFAVLNGQTRLSPANNGGGSPWGNIGLNLIIAYTIPQFVTINNYSTFKG